MRMFKCICCVNSCFFLFVVKNFVLIYWMVSFVEFFIVRGWGF